uniref:Cadherin domain-containing protein n=1 Tax=Steinernema glaseri TaxID=37863 RepID=A0A1I8AIA9_9BILA
MCADRSCSAAKTAAGEGICVVIQFVEQGSQGPLSASPFQVDVVLSYADDQSYSVHGHTTVITVTAADTIGHKRSRRKKQHDVIGNA